MEKEKIEMDEKKRKEENNVIGRVWTGTTIERSGRRKVRNG